VPAPDRAGVHAVKRGEVFEVNFEHDTFPIVSTGGCLTRYNLGGGLLHQRVILTF
jgi:hypothetical protein